MTTPNLDDIVLGGISRHEYGTCNWHTRTGDSPSDRIMCGRLVVQGKRLVKKSTVQGEAVPGTVFVKYDGDRFESAFWVCEDHLPECAEHNASGNLFTFDGYRFAELEPTKQWEVTVIVNTPTDVILNDVQTIYNEGMNDWDVKVARVRKLR